MTINHGGDIIADRLVSWGISSVFTLCGGHISPILTGARARGIDVVDVRDEASAVFAADAVARMTGVPGVAAVTAGPGVTNTITAIKNAQMAQSPVIIIGGATPTILKGRGSLQDIDQLTMLRPLTKWAASFKSVSELGPAIDHAIKMATSGVPGPVFLEIPVDLLYPEEIVREWFINESGVKNASGLGARALEMYLQAHLLRQFKAPAIPHFDLPKPTLRSFLPGSLSPDVDAQIDAVARELKQAERPVLIVGSQAVVNMTPEQAEELASAVEKLGIPTFLGGAARGLLGRFSDIQFRHKRSKALKEADLAIVAGFPFDFRLGYGRSFGKNTKVVSANLSQEDLTKNRRPEIALLSHPGKFLMELADVASATRSQRSVWFENLQTREDARDEEIAEMAEEKTELINPMHFFLKLEERLSDDAVLVVDGGDFVATGAYILRPRAPLSWLDPGVFGTLGVGGGFAVGAAVSRPDAEIWLIYGDGSSGYSLAEFDTCVRHGLAPIAVIGNDGSWAQIARDQVEILGDDVATTLLRADYHTVAKGYGAQGILVKRPGDINKAISRAQELAREGTPVVINLHISSTEFRKGSISM